MSVKGLINNKIENIIAEIIIEKSFKLRKIEIPKLIKVLCELTNNSSPSYRDIALEYFIQFNEKISKVSFFNVLQNSIEGILINILNSILFGKNTEKNLQQNMFDRIIIQDSTVLKLPDSAPSKFLGLVKGKGCKIQTYFDILDNNFSEIEITPFNVNEQKYSHEVKNVIKANDLIIRDLGYFVVGAMHAINEAKAFFLSKIHTNTKFYTEEGIELDLLELLKTETNIDLRVLMTNQKLPVRIVASRLPEEVGNQRRQKKKEDRKSNPNKRSLAILDWNILVTNIYDTSIDMDTLINLYKLRWKIETIFKTWKSYCKITNFHERISGKQVIIYTLCRLINILLLNQTIVKTIFNKSKLFKYTRVSYQSLMQNLSKKFNQLISATTSDELWSIVKKIIPYSLYEKRKKRTNMLELETITLSLMDSTMRL